MGRLRWTSVDRDATCVAEVLGQGPTPGETAGFKEQIETHAASQGQAAGQKAGARGFLAVYCSAACSWFYGFGMMPRNLPFFFSAGFAVSLFSAVFSGASFNSGAT